MTGPLPSAVGGRIVDLSHPVTTDMPIWPGDPVPLVSAAAAHDVDGYFINVLTLGEHSGTHWVAPRTFDPRGRSAESFTAADLVLPAVLLDATALSSDGRFGLEELAVWEGENGQVPRGAMVVLFTGRDRSWGDPAAFFGEDESGAPHWPGLTRGVVTFLLAARGVAGFGTDTHGIDGGGEATLGASRAVAAAGCLMVECLAGLGGLPAVGWTIVIGGLAAVGGSGGPARVLAVLAGASPCSSMACG